MVDNRTNLVLNDGDELFRFMPNQIYIVNEPVHFPEPGNRPPNLIEFKTLPCLGVPELIERRNGENLSFFQMMWDQAGGNASHRFPNEKNAKILTDRNNIIQNNNNNEKSAAVPIFEIARSDQDNKQKYDDEDDEDDVVFVKEYQENGYVQHLDEPRRNPSRKARNSKFGKNTNDENIYEEDFCILDSTDGESSPDEVSVPKSSQLEQEKPQNLSLKDLKEWPVNGLHERPKFNVITQKIEKFDYNNAESESINNNNVGKKSKIIEAIKSGKTPKKPQVTAAKKYAAKRKPATKKAATKSFIKVNPKVAFHSLKDLIQDNAKIVFNFVEKARNLKENGGLHGCHDVVLNLSIKENVPENSHKNCVDNYENLINFQNCLASLLKEVNVIDGADSPKPIEQ